MNQLLYIRHVSHLALVILLSACAVSKTGAPADVMSLNESIRSTIGSTSIYIGQDPNNNANMFTYYGSSGQQFGILGVLIESALASSMEAERQNREAALVPLRNAMIQYNYGSRLRAQLEQAVQGHNWLEVREINKEPVFQASMYSQLRHQTNSDALLVVDAYYRMADDFTRLQVSADVVMFANNSGIIQTHKLNTEAPVVYNNKFAIEINNPAEDVVNDWLRNDADNLHKAFDYANNILGQVLLEDLDNRYRNYKSMPQHSVMIAQSSQEAFLVSQIEQTRISRNLNGEYLILANLDNCCRIVRRPH